MTFPLYLSEGVLHSSVTTWIGSHFNITDNKAEYEQTEIVNLQLATDGQLS
jgi:hypothetical protein